MHDFAIGETPVQRIRCYLTRARPGGRIHSNSLVLDDGNHLAITDVVTAVSSVLEQSHRRTPSSRDASARYHREHFGTLPDGSDVFLHRLTNCHGATVSLIDYGAIVTSVIVPDGDGRLSDVVLGYDGLDGYLTDAYFVGAVVGRYANRIANGHLVIDGKSYQLPQNQGTNHLHGGPAGFYRARFVAEPFVDTDASGVRLIHVSPDGDAGYPGTLSTQVIYRFDDTMSLSVEYLAETTRTTVVNLTQHSYFNLAGTGSIVDHELRLVAFEYTPTDERAIPTGELRKVDGSPFDFRSARRIGERIDLPDDQLRLASGYDHNWVVAGTPGELRLAAELTCRASGRRMTLRTTEPGIQFYSGNFLPRDGSIQKVGQSYGWREGLCLETQHFPDSPNQPTFPSTLLGPGATYRSMTKFSFSRF
jgi:aldose 1-epimerase